MRRNTVTTALAVGVVAAALVLLSVTPPKADVDLGSGHSASERVTKPDWTVPPCTADPAILPKYTYRDWCYNPDQTVIAVSPRTDVDCNNDSYNTGGKEYTLPNVIFRAICS